MNDTLNHWKYKIQNDIFFLYNETDTLIDEMKNGLDGFKFTYHNNEPYVFGAYQRKDNKIGETEYVILFSNNKGVKYKTSKNNYKIRI